ncbi:MAG: ABC transporter ATP-binding protein [Ignavibacteriaceae bacterium]|nr:ABC transporter ATP-binding protein [Ignavibacteriaceae bacterium]
MLEISNLTKFFANFCAVDSLNLSVKKGDFFGFLGPNGAGKTTTIKMITGLVRPNSGSVSVGGFTLENNPREAKRLIGYIPDQPYLYDKLSGKEFLYFSGGLFGLRNPALKQKVDEVVELLKIGDWLNKRTENYSQGMRQRISIASSLLHDPALIVVDEPMVGLDPQSAKVVKDVFSSKAREGVAILMSTHSLHIAEEICSRIGVIKDGKLIFDGDISGLEKFKINESENLEDFFLRLVE